jgi:hypothetical protein
MLHSPCGRHGENKPTQDGNLVIAPSLIDSEMLVCTCGADAGVAKPNGELLCYLSGELRVEQRSVGAVVNAAR